MSKKPVIDYKYQYRIEELYSYIFHPLKTVIFVPSRPAIKHKRNYGLTPSGKRLHKWDSLEYQKRFANYLRPYGRVAENVRTVKKKITVYRNARKKLDMDNYVLGLAPLFKALSVCRLIVDVTPEWMIHGEHYQITPEEQKICKWKTAILLEEVCYTQQ